MKNNMNPNDDSLDIVFNRKKDTQVVETRRTFQMEDDDDHGTPPPSQNKPKPKTKKKNSKGLMWQRIIAGVLIFCVTVGVIGSGGIYIFASNAWKKSPELYPENFYAGSTTTLYSDKDEEYYKTGLKVADAITYEELPQVLVDAFIATEDSRFFIHNGVDVPRFAKAMMINAKDSIKQLRFRFSQGGSTITMQLIKNTFFVNEDVQGGDSNLAASSGIEGVERKMQELYLATKLEKEEILTKQEQIAFYLNTIYFGAGNNTMGIQSSSQRYFGKDVHELNLIESAFLAGVINAPNSYSPYQSIRKAKERTQTILDLMKMHGYITADEHKVASAIPLENVFVDRSKANEASLDYQAYIDIVHEEVVELTGVSLTATPMNVYTNMNMNVQQGIDKVQRREVANLNPGESYLQMGSAVIENNTGAIVGVFGGYDYDARLAFNRARDAKAQPGSVIKAVISYPLAFEHLGISSQHVMTDAPYVFAGMTPDKGQVNNYDGRYLGDVELDFNFADSRNTTAIRLLEDVAKKIGNEAVMTYLNDIGLTGLEHFNPAIAIGGGEMLSTPLQLGEALATIMNQGEHIKATSIRKVEFLNGRETVENSPKGKQVLDPASAYLTTELMRKAVSGSSPGYMIGTRRSYPVFGKTGTNAWSKEMTQKFGIPENSAKNRNMYTATDRFSIATWVGFDDEKPEHKPYIIGRISDMNFTGTFNSYVLNLLESEFGPGGSIEKPADVADITHIKGPFPYQRPIEGMKEDMIVTGLINKKHLTLVDPEPQTLVNLKEAIVESSQDGNKVNVNMTFTPYPDESKLTIAPNTREMPLPGTDRVYTGRRIYDDSWLYGAVEYVFDVLIDGKVVNTIRSSHPKLGVSVEVPNGSKLSLCGYYGYSNLDTVTSNRVCHDVDVKEVEVEPENLVSLPKLGESFAKLRALSNQGAFKISMTSTVNPDLNKFGQIISLVDETNTSLLGQTVDAKELKQKTLTAGVQDFVYDVANQTMTQGEFYNLVKGTLNIKEPKDKTKAITTFNGGKTSIKLLDYHTEELKFD